MTNGDAVEFIGHQPITEHATIISGDVGIVTDANPERVRVVFIGGSAWLERKDIRPWSPSVIA